MGPIKSITQALTLAAVLAGGTAPIVADDQNLALEPCVNGEVSATGRFETQALEGSALRGSHGFAVTEETLGSGNDDVISAFGGHRDDFLR
ncbi:MAG: hypothetical protein PVI91_16375 [Gammaproteobacteria bacterium]